MTRILVVDDAVDFRIMCREMLQDAGYEVLEAANGNEGIKVIRENEVDLVILDIIMPEKGGLETIIELRKDLPDLKIIAVSGEVSTDSGALLNLTSQFGVSKVFSKPIKFSELLETIKNLL